MAIESQRCCEVGFFVLLRDGLDQQRTVIEVSCDPQYIELSTERSEDFFKTLQAIIEEYNRRLEAVETDMSLKIEIH